MLNTVLGTKQGMKQIFTREGVRLSVTVVQGGPNVVTYLRTQDKDGYWAVQLGFGSRRMKTIKKPVLGHLKKGLVHTTLEEPQKYPRFLKEVRILSTEETTLQLGDRISPTDVLKAGDIVQVTGVSKGKGFAGGVKRWGFHGGPKTHGQSDRHRAPGSIGQATTPGRVYKGKKMAGRMGSDQKTIKNLVVLSVLETGEIELSGPVPGSRGSFLQIKKIGEVKTPYELVSTRRDTDTDTETEEKSEVVGGKEA
ncbi:MAG: 50S ribosomal protein L3 [Candidatus Blackburnbacteria bacterium]|nr:50S ribosomal protein L3 [Candidatus Blackburnbacteria bacterium]